MYVHNSQYFYTYLAVYIELLYAVDDPAVVLPAADASVKQEVITPAYPIPPSPTVPRQSVQSTSKLNLSMSAQEVLDSCKG